MLCVDFVRGIISVIFIFIFSYGSLIRIAVGIFFLGIQIFHISLVLVLIAKFQRMHDKARGIDYKTEQTTEKSIIVADGSRVYPTLPSHYAYSSSPPIRREGYYQPNYYRDQPSESGIRQHSYAGPYSGPPRDEFGRTMWTKQFWSTSKLPSPQFALNPMPYLYYMLM